MSDDFDLQAAWLRKLSSNAAGNFNSFAFRMRESLPGMVRLSHAKTGFFRKVEAVTAINFIIEDSVYVMRLENGAIATYINTVIGNVIIRTEKISPDKWFAELSLHIKKSVLNTQILSASLERFLEN